MTAFYNQTLKIALATLVAVFATAFFAAGISQSTDTLPGRQDAPARIVASQPDSSAHNA